MPPSTFLRHARCFVWIWSIDFGVWHRADRALVRTAGNECRCRNTCPTALIQRARHVFTIRRRRSPCPLFLACPVHRSLTRQRSRSARRSRARPRRSRPSPPCWRKHPTRSHPLPHQLAGRSAAPRRATRDGTSARSATGARVACLRIAFPTIKPLPMEADSIEANRPQCASVDSVTERQGVPHAHFSKCQLHNVAPR
jgi:hypothetical protein